MGDEREGESDIIIHTGAPALAILVVEDHAYTARSLELYLRMRGHRVFIAPDVNRARALSLRK